MMILLDDRILPGARLDAGVVGVSTLPRLRGLLGKARRPLEGLGLGDLDAMIQVVLDALEAVVQPS